MSERINLNKPQGHLREMLTFHRAFKEKLMRMCHITHTLANLLRSFSFGCTDLTHENEIYTVHLHNAFPYLKNAQSSLVLTEDTGCVRNRTLNENMPHFNKYVLNKC